jgi:hypothetical protein
MELQSRSRRAGRESVRSLEALSLRNPVSEKL